MPAGVCIRNTPKPASEMATPMAVSDHFVPLRYDPRNGITTPVISARKKLAALSPNRLYRETDSGFFRAAERGRRELARFLSAASRSDPANSDFVARIIDRTFLWKGPARRCRGLRAHRKNPGSDAANANHAPPSIRASTPRNGASDQARMRIS